jgi:hypothetical protein
MFEEESSHTAINRNRRSSDVDGSLPRSTRRAISRLLTANTYAKDAGRDAWEFAVTIGELWRDGVTESELRWLVCRGCIEHAEEIATTGSERTFNRQVSLRFNRRSAFVITDAGVAFSRDNLKGCMHCDDRDAVEANSFDSAVTRAELPLTENLHHHGNGSHGSNGSLHPKWDRDRRELRIGSKVVKVFKLPSPMQEAILMAFEEEHWPPRIDDPLPGHPDYPPKRRLHDTIKSLNRNQKNCLIRFMGDGTGEGIRWELIPSLNDAEQSKLLLQ